MENVMCITPSKISVQRGPGWEEIPVPCKSCWRCRANRVNDYVGRSLCEAQTSDWTVTLTFTYAPREDFSDRVLTPSHPQLFWKLLRRRGHKIKYLLTGELGELKGRAHFHAIIFGKGKRPTWPQGQRFHDPAWPHGHLYADWNADERTIRYVGKYILKGGAQDQRYLTMSKKPPLGHEWFQAKADLAVHLMALPRSFEYLPPGGHRNRPYLMTGVTRRNYLLRIIEGLDFTDKDVAARASEWVGKGWEKVARWKHQRACDEHVEDPELFLERLAAELEHRRMSQDQADAIAERPFKGHQPTAEELRRQVDLTYWRERVGMPTLTEEQMDVLRASRYVKR